MKNWKIISLIGGIILIVGLGVFLAGKQNNKTIMDLITPTPSSSPSAALNYQAVLTTTVGKITIKLNADQTPLTVNNFVTLAKKNFYNNTIFHRVLKGFMIQGGDPKGDGTGGPGYKFDDEPFTG